MYKAQAKVIYIHETVKRDKRCLARLKRMLPNIASPSPPEVVDNARLNEISKTRDWPGISSKRTGELNLGEERIFIFNTFRWPSDDELGQLRSRYPHLKSWYLLGDGAWTFRNGRATRETQLGICQNAHELHSAWGCLHTCAYCNIGEFVNIALNLEDYLERLDGLLRENPWLKLYKYDNHTDIPAFEPEYGWCKGLVEFFAKRDAYLMLYTKSHNVDHLLSLDHRGRTLICWTLSCDTVSRLIEKGAPPMRERIEAARKCQKAGYRVRARFSPIIPIKNWQEENRQMLEEYLRKVRPDVLTMDMFKWIEPRKVRDMFDLSLWDEEFVAWVDKFAAMDPKERPRPILPNGKQLFPNDLRARVYRFFIQKIKVLSPTTRIAICGETPEMWQELRPELGMTPENYVCACGPDSVPGNPLFKAQA
jgi:spore photoproduct lyase